MKIPNLRAKFKPKGCKGNIHFGKIVLTFMLVCMMTLGNVEPVKASEPLYYYDVYSVNSEYEKYVHKTYRQPVDSIPVSRGTMCYREGLSGRVDVQFNKYTGKFTITGDRWVEYDAGSFYGYYYCKIGDGEGYYLIWNEKSWYHYAQEIRAKKTNETKGSYLRTITGTTNQYPVNGVKGSHWYVRKGVYDILKVPQILIENSPRRNI